MWDRLEKEDRLVQGETSGNFYNLKFNYVPTRPQAEILSEYVRAIDRLYEPSRYLARAYRYYLTMRPARQALALQAGEHRTAPPPSTPGLFSGSRDLRDWTALFHLIWRQGIRPRHRWQIWRQLLGIYRQNPSRLVDYLLTCLLGENLFAVRRDMLEKYQKTAQA
ncbi:MAG: DUF4070 domain-containing protein [Desulfobaccales bacterium]